VFHKFEPRLPPTAKFLANENPRRFFRGKNSGQYKSHGFRPRQKFWPIKIPTASALGKIFGQ
jgi:hypothetical protein